VGNSIDVLAELARRLNGLPAHLPELVRQLGEECVDLIKAEHAAGAGPYGEEWEPKADGSASRLESSGNLRNGWHIASASATEVTVAPTAFYAAVHNSGKLIRAKNVPYLRFKVGGRWVRRKWVRIPIRELVPDGRGLPDEWAATLKETAELTIAHLVNGK